MLKRYIDEHVIKSWNCCQVHTSCDSLIYCENILAPVGCSSIQIFLNFNVNLTLFLWSKNYLI